MSLNRETHHVSNGDAEEASLGMDECNGGACILVVVVVD